MNAGRFAFVLLVSTAVFLAACAAAPSSPKFGRVLYFKPGVHGNTVWGYVRYDSLAPAVQANAAKLGYKFGDEIPARQEEGVMYFLKPPATELRSTNPAHWARQ